MLVGAEIACIYIYAAHILAQPPGTKSGGIAYIYICGAYRGAYPRKKQRNRIYIYIYAAHIVAQPP